MQFSDQIFAGYPHIAKHQPTGTTAPGPHQPVSVFCFNAGAALYHNGTDALILVGIFIKIRTAIHQKNIGFGGTHHKPFLPIENKMITFNFWWKIKCIF